MNALKRLVDVEKLDILVFLEYMFAGSTTVVVPKKAFPQIYFLAMDAMERSRGLTFGFVRKLQIENSLTSRSVLGVEVFCVELDRRFLILNIYRHYEDKMDVCLREVVIRLIIS